MLHAGTFGEIIIKVLGLGFAVWGLWQSSWYLGLLVTSDEAMRQGYWFAFLRLSTIVLIGVLVFGFARRISYGVLNYGISRPAQGQELDVRDFLQEMILFGLGSYFLVDAIVRAPFGITATLRYLDGDPNIVFDYDAAILVTTLAQLVIAVLMIVGRRPILGFVRSLRTKEYGKKQ